MTAANRDPKIRDEDVIEALTGDGIAIERWLSLDDYLVGFYDEKGVLFAHIIEDDALSAAASKMLRKRGQVLEIEPRLNPI
ncbi:hypothetical protein ACQ4P5_23920 [Ralstonia sp. L16]|uniref:hypothetical protein n=1 Tax=Ralstonia sp. L16 TaxID=3423950 RepID=UPI003F7B2CE0